MSTEAAAHRAPAPIRPLPLLVCTLLPLALLLPFASKAFYIDDPLYLWAAKQILKNPFDYYGVIVNKWGTNQPLSDVMVIPPGYPFFLAFVGLLFGIHEVPLHVAMALSASALGAGTYLVATRLCSRPGFATLLAILSPAFLISSTTVMTDIPMTAFFVWGVYLWMIGLEKDRHALLFASGICMSLSMLFKYSGFTVVPLLLAYSILVKRRAGWWIAHLSIPVIALAAYQCIEIALYGKPQLSYSFEYVQADFGDSLVPSWAQPLIGITFTGGSFASIALMLPLLYRPRAVIGGLVAIVVATIATVPFAATFLYTTRVSDALTLWLSFQNAFWFICGLFVLAIAAFDLWRRRDRDSILLFLWVFGSFAFATMINWSVNARALLPMLAPLVILAVRRLDSPGNPSLSGSRQWIAGGLLAIGAALSILLTYADFTQANIARTAAKKFAADDKAYPGQYYFEDHWGFQYYMEEGGVPYLDPTKLQAHDRIVAPLWGSVNASYNPSMARRVAALEFKQSALTWVTTMHPGLCAGFYAHTRGPMPFAFGPVPPEEYAVFQVEHYDQH